MFSAVLYLLIIIACGSVGILKSLKYSTRVEELQAFTEALKLLENEMKYRRDPLPETFLRISDYKENSASVFFSKLFSDLTENRSSSLMGCWNRTVDEIYGKGSVSPDDIEIMKDIGIELGRSDLSGQSNMFHRIYQRLEKHCQEATHEKNTKGKMYKSMGVTIGVVIVIILI